LKLATGEDEETVWLGSLDLFFNFGTPPLLWKE